jgi:hypothetical protein
LAALFTGDPLLARWVLASDSFYFTDLPFFAVGRWLLGDQITLIYLAPLVIYGLLLATALLLIGRTATQRRWMSALVLLVLIGVPFAPGQYMLRVAAFHTATVLFSLVGLTAIAPVLEGRRVSLGLWGLFGAALFLACASDPMAVVFFALPLLAFLLLDGLRQRAAPRPYLALAFVVIVMVFCAGKFPLVMQSLGGFITRPSYSNLLSLNPTSVFENIGAEIAAFGILFGVTDLRGLPLTPLVSVIRAAAAIWVLISVAGLLLRTPRDPRLGVARFLVLAALALLAADALSITFNAGISAGPGYPNASVRYVAPAFLFLCLAAALAPAAWPKAGALQPLLNAMAMILAAIVMVAIGVSGYRSLSAPSGLRAAPAYAVMVWLRNHRLTYGVGDYYTTQLVRALSGGGVMADPVVVSQGRLIPDRFWTDTTRFDQGQSPQYIIFPDPNFFNLTEADALATYGPPRQTAWVSGVRIMLYATPVVTPTP